MPVLTKTPAGFHLRVGNKECEKPKSCDGCPLLNKLLIPPDHKDFRNILAIGEGPGNDERIEMLPFTGDSGKYLRAVEKDVGASKWGIGHTNIILCEGGKYLEFNFPDLLQKAISCCSTLLWKEIEELDPLLLVPMGNYPKSVILPDERRGIGSCYGLFYKADKTYWDVVPIHHPAHIIRNPKMHQQYMDEWNEVRLVFEQKPGPFVIHTGNLAFIESIRKSKQAPFIDFETTSFHPWDSGEFKVNYGDLYGKPYPNKETIFNRGEIILMSVCLDGLNPRVYTREQVIKWLPYFKETLEETGVSCHNGQFDVLFLKKYGINPELIDDTMLMSYSTDESPRHGLKGLGRRHLGLEDWSEVLEKYPMKSISYAYIPPKVLKPYCGMDTASSVLLKGSIEKRQDEDSKRLYRDILMPCANMFLNLNHRGIRIDIKRLMHLKRKWMKRRLEVINQLKTFGVKNWGSPYQISDALYRLGVVDYEAATAKSNMDLLRNQCIEDGNREGEDFINLVIEARELGKAIDTQLLDVAKSTSEIDCRVHPDCKLFATVTGRLVISGPGLLNFPRMTRLSRDLRELFIPDKGMDWRHRDEKTFEYRVYAAYIDDKSFKEMFRKGIDPHKDASLRYIRTKYKVKEPEPIYDAIQACMHDLERQNGPGGYTEEEVLSLALVKLELTAPTKEMSAIFREIRRDIRGILKTVGFGKLYGREAPAVANHLGITVDEAAVLLDDISSPWEGYDRFVARIEKELTDNQEIVNPLGRKRRFPIITEDNYSECFFQARNFPIQSTANDLNLMGMVTMFKSDYYKHGLIQPFFPIHDAIEYQDEVGHEDEIEEWVKDMLSKIPETVLKVNDLKFLTDAGRGSNWAEASMKA